MPMDENLAWAMMTMRHENEFALAAVETFRVSSKIAVDCHGKGTKITGCDRGCERLGEGIKPIIDLIDRLMVEEGVEDDD